MKKQIIFGAPYSDEMGKYMVKNLEFCGFDVKDITITQKFKYKNYRDRLINFSRKIFLNDNSYKKKVRLDSYREKIDKNLHSVSMADYGLIIRPDLYPIEFLKDIKKKCKHFVGYQWDGMSRFKDINEYVEIFDKFYVFDPIDVKENLYPTTNFYFDYDVESINNINQIKQVYFLGSFLRPRLKNLSGIIEAIKKTDFKLKILIYNPKKRKIENAEITSLDTPITFEKNIEFTKQSEVLIDIHNNVHNGLSFRTFDAIKYQKKLITNNSDIKNYDFYNENNIFVWNENNFHILENFLQKPFIRYNELILNKYSFSNWINYMLNIDPKINID